METKIEQYIKTSKLLFEHGYYNQSITQLWIALRLSIFQWLTNQNIPYESSREALLKFIQHFPYEDIGDNIWCLETISIMCEWDLNYNIDKNSTHELLTLGVDAINKTMYNSSITIQR